MPGSRVLWLGCGSLGVTTAPLLQAQGLSVTGVRRDASRLPNDVAGISADVLDIAALRQLASEEWAAIIVTLTAGGYSEAEYQRTYVEGARSIARAFSREPLLLFASSTSVYENANGDRVDEDTVLNPVGFSGRAMLEAEQILAEGRPNSCAVRFAGIYGRAEPRMLQQLRNGTICPSEPAQYTNRIHYLDAGRALVHLLRHWQRGADLAPCYIAADSYPATKREVTEWLARGLALDIQTLKEAPDSGRGYNKRCSNARLLATHFRLEYPDFRSGMATWLGQDT